MKQLMIIMMVAMSVLGSEEWQLLSNDWRLGGYTSELCDFGVVRSNGKDSLLKVVAVSARIVIARSTDGNVWTKDSINFTYGNGRNHFRFLDTTYDTVAFRNYDINNNYLDVDSILIFSNGVWSASPLDTTKTAPAYKRLRFDFGVSTANNPTRFGREFICYDNLSYPTYSGKVVITDTVFEYANKISFNLGYGSWRGLYRTVSAIDGAAARKIHTRYDDSMFVNANTYGNGYIAFMQFGGAVTTNKTVSKDPFDGLNDMYSWFIDSASENMEIRNSCWFKGSLYAIGNIKEKSTNIFKRVTVPSTGAVKHIDRHIGVAKSAKVVRSFDILGRLVKTNHPTVLIKKF